MLSTPKLPQASLALPQDFSSNATDFRVQVRSRGAAPFQNFQGQRALDRSSCFLRLFSTQAAVRRLQGSVPISAQSGLGKPAGPARWHSPVESRECGADGRRTAVSRRSSAGGVLDRPASTDEERAAVRGPDSKDGRGGREQHVPTVPTVPPKGAPKRAAGARPQLAFAGGVDRSRLHNLGCEQSEKQEGMWREIGPVLVKRSEKVHQQGARSPAVKKVVELRGWLPSPKQRLVREATGRTQGPDDQAERRFELSISSEHRRVSNESSEKRPRTSESFERRAGASGGGEGEESSIDSQVMALRKRGLAAKLNASSDGPSTSGRAGSALRSDASMSGRKGQYVGGVSDKSVRGGGFETEPSDDSEEEEESRKAAAEAAGEHITYDSLKKNDVDTAVRIEKRLLRDGLLVAQARALALYVVKNEISGGYDAVAQRLSFLEGLQGLKPKQAVALLLAQKRTLKRPVHELEGNVGYLLTAGVPADQLGNVVRRSPQILLTSVAARLEPSVRCLKGLGLDVGKMVVKNPRVLTCDLEGRGREVIEYLHSVGLSHEEVQALLEKDATLLTMTLETLAKKVEFLFRKCATVEAALDLIKSSPHALYADVEQAVKQVEMVFATFGLEVGDTFDLLIKWPALMSMTKRPMLEKVEFVINELGWSVNDVLAYPLFLSFSLEKKLRPRCEKVLREGIVIAKPNESEGLKLHTMLVCSDDNFEHYLSEIWPNKYRRGPG